MQDRRSLDQMLAALEKRTGKRPGATVIVDRSTAGALCALMHLPIFHHLQDRKQTRIFLCVLAYHLLAAIEHRFLQAGIHTSWWTIRQQLSSWSAWPGPA